MKDQGNSQSDFQRSGASFSASAPARARIVSKPPATTAKKMGQRGRIRLAVTRVVVVLATLFTLRYFYWRAFNTMNPAAKVFFYAFLTAEILSFFESALFYFTTWNPTRYSRPQALPGKTVDVFIPTYNEPVELLRETVVCAVNMNYPHKTYVLDDGRREEVRRLAQELGCGYITRDNRDHAKSGNLNNALSQTTGEFIVTLDADHVATPELIDEMLGFFADPQIAVVQGTQDFYNLDSFQHLVNWKKKAGWQQQELFFSVIQPGKDRFNAAFYCGSPGIIRRAALEEIDGFPTGTITEDMHTSLRLQKKGWRVLYFNRTVARGLAPQTFSGFAGQWQRWGIGAMQVMRQENPLFCRGLSFGQRICYFSSFYFYWMSFVKLFFVLTPIISLCLGVFPLVTQPLAYADYFLPYFLLNIVCSIILQGGFRNFFASERFNLLKMHVLMKSIAGLVKTKALFFVTPKARAAAARAGEVVLPLVILIALGASLFFGAFRIEAVPVWGFTFWALAVNIFWSAIFLLMIGGVVQRSLERKEQRSNYRFQVHLDVPLRVSYTDSGKEVRFENFARNLNRSGVSVTLDKPIVPGTPVKMELWLPNHTVHVTGQVVRNKTYGTNGSTRYANGIRFEEITSVDQDEISKYLFWEIAPKEARLMQLTHSSQREEVEQA